MRTEELFKGTYKEACLSVGCTTGNFSRNYRGSSSSNKGNEDSLGVLPGKEQKLEILNNFIKLRVSPADEDPPVLTPDEAIVAQDIIITARITEVMKDIGVLKIDNKRYEQRYDGKQDLPGEQLAYYGEYLTSVRADRSTEDFDRAMSRVRVLKPTLQLEVAGLKKELSDREQHFEENQIKIQAQVYVKEAQLRLARKLISEDMPIVSDAALERTKRDLKKYKWFQESMTLTGGQIIDLTDEEEFPRLGAEAPSNQGDGVRLQRCACDSEKYSGLCQPYSMLCAVSTRARGGARGGGRGNRGRGQGRGRGTAPLGDGTQPAVPPVVQDPPVGTQLTDGQAPNPTGAGDTQPVPGPGPSVHFEIPDDTEVIPRESDADIMPTPPAEPNARGPEESEGAYTGRVERHRQEYAHYGVRIRAFKDRQAILKSAQVGLPPGLHRAIANITTLKPDGPISISEWLRSTKANLVLRGVMDQTKQVQLASSFLQGSLNTRWVLAHEMALKANQVITWQLFCNELLTSTEGKQPAEKAREDYDSFSYNSSTASENIHRFTRILDTLHERAPGTKIACPSGYDVCQMFLAKVVANLPVTVKIAIQSGYQQMLMQAEQSQFFQNATNKQLHDFYNNTLKSLVMQAKELVKQLPNRNGPTGEAGKAGKDTGRDNGKD